MPPLMPPSHLAVLTTLRGVFLGYSVQSALHFATFFAFTSASTYLMVDVLGRPAYEYGAWFVFMAVFVAAGLGSAERLAGRARAGRIALAGSAVVQVPQILQILRARSVAGITASPPEGATARSHRPRGAARRGPDCTQKSGVL